MAKGVTKSTTFKPGDKRASLAGQKSKRSVPADLKDARLENAHNFEQSIYKYMGMDPRELKTIYGQPGVSTLDNIVIKILTLALEKGDYQRLNFLLERTIGKVQDRIEIKAKVETYHQLSNQYKDLSYEELREKYFEAMKVAKIES